MPTCVAPNCNHYMGKKWRHIALFYFPRDKKMQKRWEEIINIHYSKPGLWKLTPSSRVCEYHFEESNFWISKSTGKKHLMAWAIPTIFTPRSNVTFVGQEKPKPKAKLPKSNKTQTDIIEIN